MLSAAERAKLQQEWLVGMVTEADRRQAAKLEALGGDDRERLYRMLDLMHERRKMAPGYREPTPAEKAAHMADLDQFFRQYYPNGNG